MNRKAASASYSFAYFKDLQSCSLEYRKSLKKSKQVMRNKNLNFLSRS